MANDGNVSKALDDYLDQNQARFEEELYALLRIPSVSAQPDHNTDTRNAALFVRDNLRASGIDAQLVETAGHPIVRADVLNRPGQPTLLIYGHYDVQPPEPLEPWHTKPFEPTLINGNIYARGATDDKGQMFTYLKAIEAWMKVAKALPINVIVLIEGEEEVGGANLEKYVAENAASLRCDYAVISDTSQFAPGIPAITYGLKGLAYYELEVRGAKTDLHSGMYGGAVGNPVNALTQILATFIGRDGRILIPGFYDDVRPLEEWEREQFRALGFSEADFQNELGVPLLQGEVGYSTLERRWARPTCDINGIFGGYAGPGPKTVLPCKAGAKFSFRLVPGQDPAAVTAALKRHIAAVCPPSVTYNLIEYSGAPAVLVDTQSPGMAAAKQAVAHAFGREPVLIREGGSIPVVGLLKHHLNVDTLLLGWGQPDDNLHGPNEKFAVADFHKGIKAGAHLFAALAKP